MTNRDKDFWTPRPGHVYLWTDSHEATSAGLWQTLKEPALIEIDPSHLDPKLFKADEDFAHMMYYHPYELMDVPENDEGEFDYSDVPDYGYGQPPAADRSLRDYWTSPKNVGLGEWADRAGLDSHDMTIERWS
jgi:hypothetical protein